MSSRKSLLLVDADSRSLRVLEVSLRKVGYTVRTAETAASALQAALTSPPDLVVAETQLPDYDGFELGRRLRQDARTRHTLLVFLTEGATPELKVRGIDVGADEFLTKPVLVKEVISRIRTLLERRDAEGMHPDPGTGLSGTLANMGVVDLLQVMEAGDKSGTAKLASDPVRSGGYVEGRREQGIIFFRDGRVVDAELGRLRGQDAVHRMMLWEDGLFEVEFGDVARNDEIGKSSQTLLLEGLKIVDAWSQYADRIPALQSRLRADLQVASKRGALPREVQEILSLFDGRRTLFEVVSHSALPQQTALRILAALNEQGALQLADESMGDVEALEAWLDEPVAEPAGDDGLDLPSALEQAVIPSPESPSEILAAYDPTASQSSQPLLRQTLSASYVGPLPSRAPEPAVGRRRPMLRVQRVGSTIDQLPTLSEAPAVGLSRESPAPAAPTPLAHPGSALAAREASQRAAAVPAVRTPAPERLDVPPPATYTPLARAGFASGSRTEPHPVSDDDAPFGPPGPMTGGSASGPIDQRAVDTQELPRTPSLADQTAALAHAPAAYTPSEASTFKDDFFKGDAEAAPPAPSYGPPPWVIAALVLAVVFGLVFAIANSNREGAAEKEEVATQTPPAEGPEAKARAAMETAAQEKTPDPAPAAGTEGETDESEAAIEASGAAQALAAGPSQGEGQAGASAQAGEPGPSKPTPPAPEKKAVAAKPAPKPETAPEPSGPDPRNEARKLVRTGDQALERGQLSEAESRYRQALELNGRNAAAQSGLAFVHMERAEDDQALTMARNALRLDRRQARAHLVLGLIAFNRNDRDEARKSYEAYLALAPNGRHAPDVRDALENLR